MKNLGNPYYKDVSLDTEEYFKKCKETTEEAYSFSREKDHPDDYISSDEDIDNALSDYNFDDVSLTKGNEQCFEKENEEEKEYVENDTIRKFQFNYNSSSCFGDNLPEIGIKSNKVKEDEEEPLVVAPGEGKIPTDFPENWELKSFPAHFPDGRNDMEESRDVQLSEPYYITQRLMNVDTRFANDPAYNFAYAAYYEKKQMESNISLSYQRGKKSFSKDGKVIMDLDDATMVMDNVKNTPKFWQIARYKLNAKLENLGPFDFFLLPN